jgi:hypothetical protein
MTAKQQNLFGSGINAYGERLSSPADPETSREAGERHKRTGKLSVHADIAFALVKRCPGKTFQELWKLTTAEEAVQLSDSTELMRRLSGLKNEGRVKQGPIRKCTVKGTRMVTWEPA